MDNDFFTIYLDRMEALRIDLHEAIEGLPDEAMDWVPGPEMNSLAVILAHTAGSLRYLIDVAMEVQSKRDRPAEFRAHGLARLELLSRLDEAFEYACQSVPRLKLDDLAKPRRKADGSQTTCGWALLHALEHGSLHLGHAEVTVQLWKSRQK